MILVDTGPLVALFDPRDEHHAQCRKALKGIEGPIGTTVAVLTEAFHMLEPHSIGSNRLREFIAAGALSVWFFEQQSLLRAFELMELYADRGMDLADASLVVAAELIQTRRLFTIDRDDFETYRVRRGHRHYAFEVLPVR